jgi:hypothetical protein
LPMSGRQKGVEKVSLLCIASKGCRFDKKTNFEHQNRAM